MPSPNTNIFTCAECGHTVERADANDVAPCPQCGKQRWEIAKHVEDTLTLYDELSVTATNREDEIIAERVQKTDLNTSANLTADQGTPSKLSVERKTKIAGFDEEGAVAEALVHSYNKRRKTTYSLENKTEEDSDYADRIFTSENDQPAKINVQIRHLDTEIIAGIGKQGSYDGDRTQADMIASISTAIDDKANIDSQLKANTLLQLIIPAPLGEAIRQAIRSNTFDCKGFKEIWITPFHEDSFPLKAS